MNKFNMISDDTKLGENVKLAGFINLYGCEIGENTKIGTFVEVQKNASIGKNCKISSHTFICEGVTVEDECFIGHHVVFINDKYPRATDRNGNLEGDADWADRFIETRVCKRASVGSNSTILGGVTIGAHSVIGAGSVVTKDVPPNEVWAGNPAGKIKDISEAGA